MPSNPNIKTVTVRIGITGLRRQRDHLIKLAEIMKETEELDGLINMLDEMLDQAEGFPRPRNDLEAISQFEEKNDEQA